MALLYETHRGSTTSDRDGLVTHTRSWRYFAADPSARPGWGVAGIGIVKYDPHPDFPNCLATDVSANPVDGELGWFDVTYSYTNKPFDEGNAEGTGDPGQNDPSLVAPAARTPVVKFSGNTRMMPFTLDHDPAGRTAVQNSAGQPIEGQEVEDSTGVITVSFYLSGLVDVLAKKQQYKNRVNSASFTIKTGGTSCPAGTLKCNEWDGTYQYEADYGWNTACEVTLEYKWDGWHRDLLDAGFYELVYVGGTGRYETRKIIDRSTGQPISAPVRLGGNGLRIYPDSLTLLPTVYTPPDKFWVSQPNTANVAVYQRFFPYQQTSFANLYTFV
jgi:hypothetical protein